MGNLLILRWGIYILIGCFVNIHFLLFFLNLFGLSVNMGDIGH